MPSSGGNRAGFVLHGKLIPVRPWTALEDRYLRQQWAALAHAADVAEKLRRTVKSVHGRAKRQGLHRKRVYRKRVIDTLDSAPADRIIVADRREMAVAARPSNARR